MATKKFNSKKFANTITSYGVVGMKLELSLAQCQALSFHFRELTEMIESDSGNLAGAIQPLLPFLELFKDIQSPMMPDLWLNENTEDSMS